MKFNYQARTKEGEIQTGTIEAGSYESAVKTLQRHDLAVIFLEPISAVPFYGRSLRIFQRIKTKDIVIFYRQMAILFEANIPLLEAIGSVTEQIKNPHFKEILFEVETDVRGGESFSRALVKHKKIFSSFYINVIQSGEVTGKLSDVLSYLADHAEKEYILNSKVKGALIYPAFILSAFVIVAVLMLVYVVPNLTSIFIETQTQLPFITKLLIGTSSILRSWFWLIIIIIAGLGFGYSHFLKTVQGKELRDRFILKVPILGGLFRKIYLARFSENLATLLKGGVPILKALGISGQVVGNSVYTHLLEEASDEVKRGGSISSVFEKDKKNIPPTVVQMIKVGEKTAKLDSILEKLYSFYQGEVDRAVNNLAQLIEPALIIVLGAGVAFLVASILMPIYNITSGGF